MADQTPGLSDDERAELEALRAEKAAKAKAEADAAERAELERLRSERAARQAEAAQLSDDAKRREQGREMMEPDDDLNMPWPQKLIMVLVAIVLLVGCWYIMTHGGR